MHTLQWYTVNSPIEAPPPYRGARPFDPRPKIIDTTACKLCLHAVLQAWRDSLVG